MTLAKNRGLIVALGGAAALLAATLLAYRPVAPKNEDAPPTDFSAGRASASLRSLVGGGIPHPMGSAANLAVRDLIVERLTALGYTPQLQQGFVCSDSGACGAPTNIVATLGDPTLEDAVLLAAHYDSVPAGPGASDDGSGVAIVLEIARILKAGPAPLHPIVLLVTDGEEAGLLGARLFVREHPLARHIKAAVNMDARGVSGPSLMFETGTANAWLMRLYAAATVTPVTNSLCYVVYKLLPNDTDFTVFKAESYQGFNLAFIGDVGRYHTPLDNWANASASTIQHQGDNALGAVRALAGSPDLSPPPGESLFFDVYARALVVLPVKFVLPAAFAALALLLAEAVLLLRHRQLTAREAGFGAIGAIVSPLLGAVLGVLALGLLRAFGALPPLGAASWIAHPLPMHIAAAAMAFSCAGAAGLWLGKRAGYWGFWLGCAALTELLSVAAAAAQPSAAYVLLLSAMAVVLAPLPCMLRLLRGLAPSAASMGFAALLPWFATLAALLPLLLLLYAALGAVSWPVSTLALGLATIWLLPLSASASLGVMQRLLLAAAAVSLCGVLVTLFLPVYSTRWPQRVNVEYWLDADTHQAHWWVQAAAQRLPEAMAAAGSFDSMPRARYPGSKSLGFIAGAPQLELAAPQVTQSSVAASPGGVHYQLLLRSARGASAAFVIFPPSAAVQSVVVATSAGPLRAKLQRFAGGSSGLMLADIPGEGVQFEIDAAPEKLGVQIFDQSYGLPEELLEGKNLQHARGEKATSSQNGDITVVQRTVWLDPAAGR